MEIINAIAHKIIKEKQESGKPQVEAIVQYRDDIFDPENQKVITLIESILKIYKTGKTFGSFDTDVDNHPFQSWVKEIHKDDYSKEVFIELSCKTVNRLKIEIEKENFATGGYLVFAHYVTCNGPYYSVVMIKDKGGLTFNSNMDLTDVHQIDLDKLHQAARIDLNRLEKAEEAYLSFLKGDQKKDITGYFTKALGCTDLIPSNLATDNVFHLIESICSEADIVDKKSIRAEIHDFLKERHPKSVMLEEIAAKLNAYLPIEFHSSFIERANSEEFRISQEFVPNIAALKKYKRVSYKAAAWDLSFDKNILGTPSSQAEIVFDVDEKSLTINNLPQKLINELSNIIADING
ncbi:nucleoid-associated protein [Methylobacter sp. BBA5.1]|uniref:nucleoid-associated protein n=1 Tax=Methylobacter sp. BBA5.1 TaxID=1495064 RepID=UPI00056053CA|nr:nucleoid-associated protein [Methylobacter sp. BBA5.1]